MQPIRIALRADDAATTAELKEALEALRGQEPAGGELLEDTAPRPQVVDPLMTTVIIAVAAGMGQQIGVSLVSWLIESVRGIAKRRKTKIVLSFGAASLEVDAQTRSQEAAAKLLRV